jgi:uncharacterized membrane protein YfcA
MEFSANFGVGGFIAWIAGIVVLVKLFQTEGFLKGVLGLICMLYTFIWGWQHIKDESLKLKTWMYVWTGAIVIGVIYAAVSGGGDGGESSLVSLFI